MSAFEIILIGIGILIVAVSFFIPNKNSVSENSENNYQKNEEKIKEILNNELTRVQKRIEEILQQTADHAMNHSESMLEQFTNEKINDISEYSDSVLSLIQNNHDEVVFLYDMMNEKQEYLKDSSLTIQETAIRVEETVSGTEYIAEEAKNIVLDAEQMARNIEILVAESEQMAKDIKLVVGEVNDSVITTMNNMIAMKSMLMEPKVVLTN